MKLYYFTGLCLLLIFLMRPLPVQLDSSLPPSPGDKDPPPSQPVEPPTSPIPRTPVSQAPTPPPIAETPATPSPLSSQPDSNEGECPADNLEVCGWDRLTV